jgi:hypothetical protein
LATLLATTMSRFFSCNFFRALAIKSSVSAAKPTSHCRSYFDRAPLKYPDLAPGAARPDPDPA